MKKIIFSIAAVMIGTSSFAQLDRSKAPTPGPAPEINISDPDVFTLDNGMKVIVSSNDQIPKVSFNLVMTSDPRLEGDKAGLSELAGDLMLSGTTNRSKDELDKEKDFIGASLFASSSSIYLSCLTKHMDKGLTLMTDVMKNASFPQSEFDRIKKQYESNLLSVKTDPNSMASNAMYSVLFPKGHPYGEVMTEESLENITRKDVTEFYKNQFTPSGSYLVIVGDISTVEARLVAEKYFGDWEGGVPYEAKYGNGYFPQATRVIFVEKPGAVQSVINVCFPVKMKPGDDDQIKLTTLNKLFGGGGFGTRLMQNLREDKAYTYGAYSSLEVNREGSWLQAQGSFRNEVTDSAIVQFLYEFNRITEDKVTEEELELNKASMAGSFARSLESPRTIANFALNIFRNDLEEDYYKTYLKKLSEVNREDILNVAQKYFTPNQLNIIVVGNTDVMDKLLQFDGDGVIEVFDAFGRPAKKKEYMPAEISKDKVIENYITAVTQTSKLKKAKKKLSKIKTMEQIISIKPDEMPVELTMKSYFMAPNKRMQMMEFSGMVVQKEVFNGEEGVTKQMNQSGGMDEKKMTQEEIETEKKMSQLLPEMALLENEVDFELLGIDELKGEKFYVIEYRTGNTTTKAYNSEDSFMKKHSETLTITEEGPQSVSAAFSDFKEHNGILFPHQTIQVVDAATMTATVKEINLNAKIDESKFKL
ncbi:MAG: pitrilysin family protein [Brumimicrobium sp.]|nr:pitrilysin family protein [Brumimicrobium sp.]